MDAFDDKKMMQVVKCLIEKILNSLRSIFQDRRLKALSAGLDTCLVIQVDLLSRYRYAYFDDRKCGSLANLDTICVL